MVQGVGFRYTAQKIALSSSLTGWVKNVPDGSVEAVLEGEYENLQYFLENINKSMSHYVTNKEVDWLDYAGTFDGFDITY